MTDKTKAFEEEKNKQEPMTVIPISVLLIMIELLEELKLKDPEFINNLHKRLIKIKDTTLGKTYPKSVDLIEVLAKQLGGEL